MASISLRSMARSRVLTGTAFTIVAGTAFYLSRPTIKLDSAQNEPSKTLAFPTGMLFSKQLKVTGVEQINHDTKRVTFALPGGKDEVSGVTPGAAILTQHTPSGKWFPVFRPYTPVHDLDERGVLQLLVKQYPGGRASTHIHSLAPGDELTVRGPLPGYSYTPSKKPCDVILVAGGAGITPIYSLAKGILANGEDKTRIQLVWGVNGTRDIILKDELEKLEAAHPDQLHVTYVVSGPEAKPDAPSLGDEQKYRKGYINEAILAEMKQKCEQQGTLGNEKGTKVFLCGPPKMEEAIAGKSGVLGALGIQKKEIHRF